MSIEINLKNKIGLVIGIANDKSIAWGCASAFFNAGATLAVTYLNDKAKPYVETLARQIEAGILTNCNVQNDDELEKIFEIIKEKYGRLDFLLHSIAFAPKNDLQNRVTDCSREGFLSSMDISCHSFIRMAKLAENLMQNGGSLINMSYMGSSEVVENYGMMGPVKAALESTTLYLASELGAKNIRVNSISPGPIFTRAASGLKDFDKLILASQNKSSLQHLVDIKDVGNFAAFLVSDLAKNITGGVHIIDAGYKIKD